MPNPIISKSVDRRKNNTSKRKYLNHKFHQLTVIKYLGKGMVKCLCDCGNIKNICLSNIIHGSVKACGCKQIGKAETASNFKDGFRANGKARSSEYNSYINMKTRCHNPNFKDWEYYGGRIVPGPVIICDTWLDKKNGFTNFLKDMGEKPEPKKLYSIDRIDPIGNYEPNNCRWATSKEQSCNQRRYKK